MSESTIYNYLKGSSHFVLTSLEPSNLSLTVNKLIFCGYHAGPTPAGITPTNHWVLYASTGENSSCRIDISPTFPPAGQANIFIAHVHDDYQHTPNCAKIVELMVIKPATLEEIFGNIINNKRDKYGFDETGEGCRHWQLTIAEDFAQARIVSSSEVEGLRDVITKFWKDDSSGVARPIVAGKSL